MTSVQLRADRLWGKPCLGYSLQAHFCEASIRGLRGVQEALAAVAPEGMRWLSPDTFHLSVFSLVPVRWPDEGKSELWDRLQTAVGQEIARYAWDDFSIQLREAQLTETALILSTPEQPAAVAHFRARLNSIVMAAGLPSQSFDRTHVTIARPSGNQCVAARRVGSIERAFNGIAVDVRKFSLVRELVYPSLQLEVLDQLPKLTA